MEKQNQTNALTFFEMLVCKNAYFANTVNQTEEMWLWQDNLVARTHQGRYLHLHRDLFGVWRYDELANANALIGITLEVHDLLFLKKGKCFGPDQSRLSRLFHFQNN